MAERNPMICATCARGVVPVEGVTAVRSRGYWWCTHCASITYYDGQPVVAFPSPGMLIPITIMHEEGGDGRA